MGRVLSGDAESVSVSDVAVKAVLVALRDGKKTGVLKEQLRRALASAEKRDSTEYPETEEELRQRSKALDKKAERALRSLEEDGARIKRTKAPEGRAICFQLIKGPKWDEHVTGEARLALKLAAMSLSHSGTRLWHEKLEIIEQIASAKMSHSDRTLFDQLEKAVKIYGGVDDPAVSSDEDILEPILNAIATNRMVAIEHQTAGTAKAITRDFVPRAITHDLFSGGAYLLVWDPRARIPKQLRLNRISSVKVLKERGVVSREDLLENALAYQIGAWASGAAPFKVVVRIRGASWVNSLLEAPPALPGFEAILEKGSKSLLVSFMANVEEGPTRWLLQFGCCAEVLKPPALRERIKRELQETLKAYSVSDNC